MFRQDFGFSSWLFSFGFTVERTTMNLLSMSNQKGAPSEMANAVMSQPSQPVNLSFDDSHDGLFSKGEEMELNFGPQHPSTHGVFRVKLYLDGEVVVKAIPYLGYLHRGVEKLLEQLTFVQVTPIVDKNDYVSPMVSGVADGLVSGVADGLPSGVAAGLPDVPVAGLPAVGPGGLLVVLPA